MKVVKLGVISLLASSALAGGVLAAKPSISVETLCLPNGDVTITILDVSDDNGPIAEVIDVDVECLAAVKDGPGRPDQVDFGTYNIPFLISPVMASCDLGQLPAGATEWKARATVHTEGTRDRSDNCEEIILSDPN